MLAAFGDAVASGPVALALHAILGTLLLVAAITVVARAALTRKTASAVAGAAALAAIVTAWLSGARFVGNASSATDVQAQDRGTGGWQGFTCRELSRR